MQNYNNIVGLFLSRKRKQAGLVQRDISDLAGVHHQFISNVERGMCAVSTPVLKAYIKLCKIKRKELMDTVFEERRQFMKENIF